MENLPFPDEIILKILSYLNVFDFAKCAQVSKQLMNICEDKKFQQYHELKEIFVETEINQREFKKLSTKYRSIERDWKQN